MRENIEEANLRIRECIEERTTELDLSELGLRDLDELPELKDCTHLKVLFLRDNKITDLVALTWLVNLQSLDLEANQIHDISPLSRLANLQTLFLDNNQVSDLTPLSELVALESLYLSMNRINDLSPLSKLIDLESLGANSNQLIELSPLEALVQLQFLELVNNQISNLSPLRGLCNLQYLNLNTNEIDDVSPISDLYNLQQLFMMNNMIFDLRPLSLLNDLQELNVGDNEISDISTLTRLVNLKSLILRNNFIDDYSPLYSLKNLRNLSLQGNLISSVSEQFINQFSEVDAILDYDLFSGLYIAGNPLTSPPIEIAIQGKEAILAWFAANKKALNEVKLILIGDPKAGKTSLLRQLQYGDFNPDEEQTDGINIERLSFGELDTFKGQKELHDLHAHCWDFGGQEIMSATHQFFLTNRSVYVLVLDARKDKEVAGQVRNWLQRIRQKGGESPVLVVCNQIDVNPGFGFENEADLRREFPQILDFVKVSSKKGTGFKSLKDLLAKAIPEAELFKTEVDERWLPLKEDLQKETGAKQFLNEDRFLSLCTQHEVAEEVKRNSAIQFLHDLGIVLHFPRINKQYFVLDPYWITFGVYQVITSKRASEQKGKLSKDDLDYIINKEQAKNKPYKRKGKRPKYTPSQCEFLMQILEEFKLAFFLKEEDVYIIPDLLDTDEDEEAATIRKAGEKLEFLYRYPVKPAALMPHLIVDLHSSLKSYWRTGCLLRHGSCTALISIYDREVRVFVCGEHKEKREFLSVIRYQIAKINTKLKYSPEHLIPVAEDLEPLDYEMLIEMEKDGKEEVTVYKPRKVRFNIRALLDGIEEPNTRENEGIQLLKMENMLHRLQSGQDFATAERVRMHTESQQERKAISEKQDALKKELQATRDYLYERLGNEEYKGAVQQAIAEMQAESQTHLAHELMAFIKEAAEISTGHLDEQMQQSIAGVQQTDLVQTKLELGFPLLSLFGANLKAEVNLNELGKRVNEWSMRMQEQHGHKKVFALLRKVWGG